MLKKSLLALIVAVALMAGSTGPAAADSTVSNTLKSQVAVNRVIKSMLAEFDTATTGCILNKSVSTVLSYAEVGKTIPLRVAVAAVQVANRQGSGFCKAAIVIAGTAAYMQITYLKHKRVYIKQRMNDPAWWQKLTVIRWVGPAATQTKRFEYSV